MSSLTITAETKNDLTITNENKRSSDTWDEATYTWDNADGTFEVPGIVLGRDSKNSLSITNESK